DENPPASKSPATRGGGRRDPPGPEPPLPGSQREENNLGSVADHELQGPRCRQLRSSCWLGQSDLESATRREIRGRECSPGTLRGCSGGQFERRAAPGYADAGGVVCTCRPGCCSDRGQCRIPRFHQLQL